MDEIPVMPGDGSADEGPRNTDVRVRDLKRAIETDGYVVDAPAVADAILRRIQQLKQARAAMALDEAGRSRPAPGIPPAR
jgi:hypothetical protein